MKVLYIVHATVPYGANVALINLLDKLIEKDVEPLVVFAMDGKFVEWLKERKINRVKVPFQMTAYPRIYSLKSVFTFFPRLARDLLLNLIAQKKLEKIVLRFKPDIIHTNIGPTRLGFDVAQKLKISHVWHIREYQKLDFGIHFFPTFSSYKRLIKKSNCICITKGIHNYFSLSENAHVIYDGVLEEHDKVFIPEKDKYFLFVGRLEEAKGIIPLIKAFKAFSTTNSDYMLLVAGTGQTSYELKIRALLNNYNLNSTVKLLGFRDDRIELMQKATALIVPSLHEGFGFITVEAMFNGCLVIGKNTAGTKEIIENSDGSAILFNNQNELTKSMNDLVKKGVSNYSDKIEKAQKIACELYSQRSHALNIYTLYSNILSNR